MWHSHIVHNWRKASHFILSNLLCVAVMPSNRNSADQVHRNLRWTCAVCALVFILVALTQWKPQGLLLFSAFFPVSERTEGNWVQNGIPSQLTPLTAAHTHTYGDLRSTTNSGMHSSGDSRIINSSTHTHMVTCAGDVGAGAAVVVATRAQVVMPAPLLGGVRASCPCSKERCGVMQRVRGMSWPLTAGKAVGDE